MSEHDLQKENLDRIGRKLLEATRVSGDEIEKIVGAPQLFDAVKARIRAEQKFSRKAKYNFFVWNLQTASGAFAVLLVLLAVAAVIVFKNGSAAPTVAKIQRAEIPPVGVPAENTPAVPEIAATQTRPVKSAGAAEKTDFRTDSRPDFKENFKENFKEETPGLPERTKKIAPRQIEQSSKKDAKVVFYPLEVAGNWEANGEDLRVVRAELSRAELFALGVNLPVENESARIKTDLLVGADGVARAIRLIE